jgi:hypothetical protein
MIGPAFRIGDHLVRRIAHDGAEVLADERAGIVARGFGRVDDGRARSEEVLQALPYLAELNLG